MNAITIQDAIDWLKLKKGRVKFSFYNSPACGCLFTQMAFGKTGGQGTTIIRGGYHSETREMVVPFHDDFWQKVMR